MKRAKARPGPQGGVGASWSLLRGNRDFRHVYVASLVSLGGDWFLLVALFLLVQDLTGSPIFVALVLTVQEFTYFFVSPAAGHLVDRVNRKRLMVLADVLRALLCLGFLFTTTPDTVAMIFVILVAMSALSAVFEPASQAALPNLVVAADLATANALAGSLWGTMLVVGAALGGLVTAAFGRDASIVIDAVSFAASAALIASVHRPFSTPREPDEARGLMRGIREGWSYARNDARVFALLSAKFGWGLSAGVIVLLPLFARGPYHAGAAGLGALMAARGLGALVGPFIGRSWLGPGDRRLFVEIPIALAVFGLAYATLGVAPGLLVAVPILIVSAIGGGTLWTLASYGLQALVPDRLRGRIFALDAMLETLTFGCSSLVAAWLAETVGLRLSATLLGAVALLWAAAWTKATGSVRSAALANGLPGTH